MLTDIREEQIKKITLSLFVDEVNDDLSDQLKQISSANPGKVQLKLRVVDPESKMSLEMFSRSYRVSITNELIKNLNKLSVNYKVN
jgi:DNA polymerase-3 subunit alpha